MTLPVFHAPDLARDLVADLDPDGSRDLVAAEPGTQIECGAEVAGHAVRVRRMTTGERLQLVDGTGLRITGSIVAASADALRIEVEDCTQEPADEPALVLVQALAKQDRDLQAIEAATEVGVDAVMPWAAARSIAAWPAKKQERMAQKWANTLQAASLQARRSRFPQLLGHATTAGVVAALEPTDRVIVLHESAESSLDEALGMPLDMPRGEVRRIVLVVGPEGGISDAELDSFAAAGAVTARLGDTVLRASSAGPVALALCQFLLGRWSGGARR